MKNAIKASGLLIPGTHLLSIITSFPLIVSILICPELWVPYLHENRQSRGWVGCPSGTCTASSLFSQSTTRTSVPSQSVSCCSHQGLIPGPTDELRITFIISRSTLKEDSFSFFHFPNMRTGLGTSTTVRGWWNESGHILIVLLNSRSCCLTTSSYGRLL